MKKIFALFCAACSLILAISCEKGKPTKKPNFNPNGHEYVDLGLPSGVLWATCNLGAYTPEQHGIHFCWGGSTEVRGEMNWTSYFQLLGYAGDVSVGEEDCGTDKDPIKDYVFGGSKFVWQELFVEAGEANGIGATEWDAARNLWGGGWRMPTCDEMSELVH